MLETSIFNNSSLSSFMFLNIALFIYALLFNRDIQYKVSLASLRTILSFEIKYALNYPNATLAYQSPYSHTTSKNLLTQYIFFISRQISIKLHYSQSKSITLNCQYIFSHKKHLTLFIVTPLLP